MEESVFLRVQFESIRWLEVNFLEGIRAQLTRIRLAVDHKCPLASIDDIDPAGKLVQLALGFWVSFLVFVIIKFRGNGEFPE